MAQNDDMFRDLLDLMRKYAGPRAADQPTGAIIPITLKQKEERRVETPAPAQATAPVEEDAPAPDALEDEDPDLIPAENQDRRLRSRRAYHLTAGATERAHEIPRVPYSARRVFRYIQKYEIGTQKQMAHALNLERKTIEKAVDALVKIKLISAVNLPR